VGWKGTATVFTHTGGDCHTSLRRVRDDTIFLGVDCNLSKIVYEPRFLLPVVVRITSGYEGDRHIVNSGVRLSLSLMHLDGAGRQIYPEIVMLSAVKHLG